MKSLNEYIKESILDVDDLVADDNLFIEKWLKENCEIKGTYTIKDGVVNVKGSVKINSDVETIGVQFGEVTVDFFCYCCPNLTSLKGTPKEVGRDFNCSRCNSLTTLQGAPERVDGSFDCNRCINLKSLKGAPKEVRKSFDCSDCVSLTTLEGAPKEVWIWFDCSGCRNLTSLKGAPNCRKMIAN